MKSPPSKEALLASVQKCSDMMPRKVFDESAETVDEIANITGVRLNTVRELIKKKVAAGEWEQVWKQGTRTLVPAYRIKKHNVRRS